MKNKILICCKYLIYTIIFVISIENVVAYSQNMINDDKINVDVEYKTIIGELPHYCVCVKCCGNMDGITASGEKIYNGMDNPYIVSCNWLPLDTRILINDIEYTVKDTGGSDLDEIGRIDIFVPEGHQAALDLGRIKDVEIKIPVNNELKDMK